MLSVLIAAHDDSRRLVATLAALVPGAVAGQVREVIVADSGARDIAEIADAAGCRLMVSDGPTGARLKAAAEAARSSWLLFVKPGWRPDASWIGEVRNFIETSELSGRTGRAAAAFRHAPIRDTPYPAVAQALKSLAAALSARPHPAQGLLISRHFYERLGGHRASDDAETDFIRRIGRRHIVMLRSMALTTHA